MKSYSSGHPWYYKLGGAVLQPKQILVAVKKSSYRGYRLDDIEAADRKSEPARSEALRALRAEEIERIRADLGRYRELACQLREFRKRDGDLYDQPVCADIHTNISLKHNHLVNRFAHLVAIDDLLTRQPDLFGF